MTIESEAERWSPDEQLVSAILAGSPTTMHDLDAHDRAWVVAGLKLRGLTAEQIKDRLKPCSLRLVRQIASEPGATFAKLYMVEREAFADTYRMNDAEVRRLAKALVEAEATAARYKLQLDRMLDRFLTGELPSFRCGHPKTRYNTYKAPKTGKESCRQCHAKAQADYRERKRMRADSGVGTAIGLTRHTTGNSARTVRVDNGHYGTHNQNPGTGQRATRRSSRDESISA